MGISMVLVEIYECSISDIETLWALEESMWKVDVKIWIVDEKCMLLSRGVLDELYCWKV